MLYVDVYVYSVTFYRDIRSTINERLYLHIIKHDTFHICGVILLRPSVLHKNNFIKIRSDYKRIPWVVRDIGSNLTCV